MTDSNGKTPADQSAGAAERIVIRDKRKITPMGDAAGKDKPASQKDGATMPTPEDSAAKSTEPAETAETVTEPAADAATSEAAAESEATTAADSETPAAEAAPVADTTADESAEAAPETEAAEVPKAETPTAEPEEAPAKKAAAPEEEDDSGPLGAELEMLRKQLDEAQVDIKRVAAEYKNYRDRVKRDQATASEVAVAGVLAALLPVLDDLDRARDHGDLTGPFGSVAEQLLTVVGKFNLTAFGAKGDPFDPNLHEAVAHLPSPDVTEETCIDVMRRGYMLGDRLLRPAMVAVAAPPE
ncbi:nucleotide exchange factor GrpE [Hamadaea sp. NPDC051192]|uniref:nucleotide exchange factor GrpE n=1 Tax=Hamadaea sp. NPDC051192 TaxID=3154940 RepID=UPI00342D1D38